MTHNKDRGGGCAPSAPFNRATSQTLSDRVRFFLHPIGQLFRKPSSAIGTSLVIFFILLAILGPLLAPYSATKISTARLKAPFEAHWFGTDNLGRDVFSRVIFGTQSILALAGLGTLLALLSGTLFGLISGYRGGWFDEILMRSFDSLLAIPALLLALLLLGTIGPSSNNVLVVLIVVYTPIVARVVRSEVLSTKTKEFVEAARLQGESTAYILFREILPSVLPALSVEGAMRFTYAIFLVASLGFLGVGVQPPSPNWGLMVKEARDFASLAPWTLLFPTLAISLLVIGMNLMADALKCVFQAPTSLTTAPPKTAAKAVFRRRSSPTATTPVTAESSAVVSIKNLNVSYYQSRHRLDAVRDVSLHIEPGQSYGLVGESGSGKSTLAMALMRYLSPNAVVRNGAIEFAGENVLALEGNALRRFWGSEINLVPQDPLSSLNPALRVGEQIAEILRQHQGLNRTDAGRRVIGLLESVHIADPKRVADSYPHQLSGGMQQRVMIAMALCTSPRFLTLDEPTTGLDVTTEAVVLDLFRELIRARGASTLYISHDLGVVARIADRVAVLYAGELVEDAETNDLYRQPLHPYTQGLLDSVPRIGQNKKQVHLTSMRGQIPALADLPSGCVFAPRCPLALDLCHEKRPEWETVNGQNRHVRCHRWQEIYSGEISARQAVLDREHGTTEVTHKTPALVTKALKKHFRLKTSLFAGLKGKNAPTVRAVDGVSLNIQRGKTLGLVGESGSGKSTLARSVMGLLTATDGQIELLGNPLPTKLSQRDKKTLGQLQMVFQNPQETLNPYMTIGETLQRTLIRLSDQSKEGAAQQAIRLLELVRLDAEYANRLPAQLSGGEKQRVAIARAFAATPELVVCDEPTSALDVSVQSRILNLLDDLQQDQHSAYLFITHDLAVVGYLADQIAVIYLGQLMEWGQTTDIFQPPYHPYTEALLSSVPLLDPSLKRERIRLEGEIPSATHVPDGCPFHTRCPRFLGDICVTQKPTWQQAENGHRIYCHIPLETLRKTQQPIFQDHREPS